MYVHNQNTHSFLACTEKAKCVQAILVNAVLASVMLSGGNFQADTRISVSNLNLTVIVGEGVHSIMYCDFLPSYYQGKSTTGGKRL